MEVVVRWSIEHSYMYVNMCNVLAIYVLRAMLHASSSTIYLDLKAVT